MYYELLKPGDAEFNECVSRTTGLKSRWLDAVLAAVEAAQKVRGATSLVNLLNAIGAWRGHDPHEFTNRGGTNGAAYRLWMEARQALANLYHAAFPHPDPPMPGNCPGTLLVGTYVPEGEGHGETSHGFVYRWAIAAGRIAEVPTLPARRGFSAFSPENSGPVLYPAGMDGCHRVRVGGAMTTLPGDIIGFFQIVAGLPPRLAHAMIAETPTTWFSADNARAFGVGTGRSRVQADAEPPAVTGNRTGWVGAGNQWMPPDGNVLHVVYRRLP